VIDIISAPPCMKCKHFFGDKAPGYYCEAFPKGIPKVIIYSEDNHTKPYLGQDNDIIFELIEDNK